MQEDSPGHPGPAVGRDAELARLTALVDTAPAHGQVLVVLGDAGMGKSTLLASAADRARSAGMRVLWATGRESEASLAFAGLHELLIPVPGAAAALPQRQAQALLGALDLAAEPAAADRLVTGIAALTLLSAAAAALLLNQQPRPPRGQARAQVLAQAAGNPLALIELTKAIADDPAASRRWAAEPLPPGDRITAVITARLAALPEAVREALLLAAVAEGTDVRAAAGGTPGFDPQALVPAEQAGLLVADRTGVRFSHPLVRSAIYHSAPFSRRAGASSARGRTGRPTGPASMASGRRHPASRRARRLAARGHRRPRAAPRRHGRRGARAGTVGGTQPRPTEPGPPTGVGRFSCGHRWPGRLGSGSHRTGPGDRDGTGNTAASAQQRRVGAGLRGPAIGGVRRPRLGRGRSGR